MRIFLYVLKALFSCTLTLQAQPTITPVADFPSAIRDLDALDARRYIVATDERVVITYDQGVNWIVLDSARLGDPRGYRISAHGNDPLLYTRPPSQDGTPTLEIHFTRDGGRFWEKRTVELWKTLPQQVRGLLPVTAHVTRQDSILLFYPTSVHRISAASSPTGVQLFASADTILDAVARGDTVLLCTTQGLFLSTDAGSTWNTRFAGTVDQVLLNGFEYVTIMQVDRRILTSSDMGVRWDTIPFPMPPAIDGYETRVSHLIAMHDGSSTRLRLDSRVALHVDTVGHDQGERLMLDYDPAGRAWDRLESLPSGFNSLDYVPDGWYDESFCLMRGGARLFRVTQSIDTTAPLGVHDQSGYSKRCIRLDWLEYDHGRWNEAVLERSDDGAPWQDVGRIAPPGSFFTSTYVDSTIDQNWNDVRTYRYRLTKNLIDGGSRQYLSMPVTPDNNTVSLDLLEYVIPPRDTWLHYDADGKRSSIFLDRIQTVDEYRTDVILRHMTNYVSDAPYRYFLLRFRDEYLYSDSRHSHEVYYGLRGSRYFRIVRTGETPPDTIELRGHGGGGWTAIDSYTRYVRGLGLLSHIVVGRDIRNGALDTMNVIYLRLVTTDVHEAPSTKTLNIENLYPNPFDARRDAALTIDLRAADIGPVRVTMHDLLGRTVAILHDGPLDSERRTLSWSGRTRSGELLSPGIYFLRAMSRGSVVTRKVVVRGY